MITSLAHFWHKYKTNPCTAKDTGVIYTFLTNYYTSSVVFVIAGNLNIEGFLFVYILLNSNFFGT
nr:MAG TPA: hypothetical protein [Caudoviricetes sp.]